MPIQNATSKAFFFEIIIRAEDRARTTFAAVPHNVAREHRLSIAPNRDAGLPEAVELVPFVAAKGPTADGQCRAEAYGPKAQENVPRLTGDTPDWISFDTTSGEAPSVTKTLQRPLEWTRQPSSRPFVWRPQNLAPIPYL